MVSVILVYGTLFAYSPLRLYVKGVGMPGMFSSSFQRLGAAAAARETYQTVISSNIANADTPHFKADKRSFSDFFKNIIFSGLSGNFMIFIVEFCQRI